MKPINLSALFFALALSSPLLAGADDYIEWKPVPGSSGYQLQVRETVSKKLLLDRTVEGTMLDVDLALGSYEHRLAPLSPFGKPIVWSDWKTLSILVSRAPSVNESETIVVKERRTFLINLTGENFARSMKVYLKGEHEVIPVPNRTIGRNGTELTASVSPEKIPPGTYSIILENPRQKIWTGDGLVSLTYSPNAVAVLDPATSRDKTQPQKQDKTDKTDKTGKQNDKRDPSKTQGDYREQLRTMKASCAGAGLPDFLILHCYKSHVVLDLSTPEKNDMYNYLRTYQGNYSDRERGYAYFRERCGSLSSQVHKILEERMQESGASLDLAERQDVLSTIEAVKNCGP